MPNKPLRPCAHPGCPNLVSQGSYCEQHKHIQTQRQQETNKHYDAHQRDQRAKRFYQSKAWLAARQQALIRDHGLCQACLRNGRLVAATTVHHKVEIRDDWSKRLQLDNLESLCAACHNVKHGGRGGSGIS